MELEEEWLIHQPVAVMYVSSFKDVGLRLMVFLVAILRLIQNSLHTISVEVSFTMANIRPLHSTILRDLLCNYY